MAEAPKSDDDSAPLPPTQLHTEGAWHAIAPGDPSAPFAAAVLAYAHAAPDRSYDKDDEFQHPMSAALRWRLRVLSASAIPLVDLPAPPTQPPAAATTEEKLAAVAAKLHGGRPWIGPLDADSAAAAGVMDAVDAAAAAPDSDATLAAAVAAYDRHVEAAPVIAFLHRRHACAVCVRRPTATEAFTTLLDAHAAETATALAGVTSPRALFAAAKTRITQSDADLPKPYAFREKSATWDQMASDKPTGRASYWSERQAWDTLGDVYDGLFDEESRSWEDAKYVGIVAAPTLGRWPPRRIAGVPPAVLPRELNETIMSYASGIVPA